jgi:hypothetical protein
MTFIDLLVSIKPGKHFLEEIGNSCNHVIEVTEVTDVPT